MVRFNLDTWLQDKSRKVVTRSGHNVRILCTDQRGNMPIVALVEFETLDGVQIFYSDGKNESHREYDLFFADEEEKPQSIEIPFGAKDSEFVRDEYYIPEGCEARIEGNKIIIEKIQKEELTELQKTLEEDCDCYVNLYNDGKTREELREWIKGWCPRIIDLARKEILKSLPKWKKATEHKEFDVQACVMDEDMYPYLDIEVNEGEYYIEFSDLKHLPKEE